MIKNFFSLFLAAVVLLSTATLGHAKTFTASYKITVHIPNIVGFTHQGTSSIDESTRISSRQETFTQEVWRDGQKIVLETTVVK